MDDILELFPENTVVVSVSGTIALVTGVSDELCEQGSPVLFVKTLIENVERRGKICTCSLVPLGDYDDPKTLGTYGGYGEA